MNIPTIFILLAVATTQPTPQATTPLAPPTTPIQVIVQQPPSSGGMPDSVKIAITAVLGAIFTVLTFVVGQILQRMFIEPIQEQRKLVGKIAYAITYHADNYHMSHIDPIHIPAHVAEVNASSKAIRDLASNLKASVTSIPCYDTLEDLGIVIHRRDIGMVAYLLMGWQLRMNNTYNVFASREIQKRLKIEAGEKEAADDINKWVAASKDFLMPSP